MTRFVACFALILAATACQPRTLTFPIAPISQQSLPGGGRTIGYDTNGDGKEDYRQTTNAAGQVVRLEFNDGKAEAVDLTTLDRAACPHMVIILDGANVALLEKMRAEGHFRLFPPPCVTVAPFPVMTDLAINNLLHTGPSIGYEARYFDRAKNKQVGGLGDYVAADNSPWVARTAYRISFRRDADAYLHPTELFHDELAGMNRVFAKATGPGTVIAYTVGTAGMGTKFGEKGMRQYLAEIDRFCEQIVWQRRGRVSLTITADHGQNLLPGKRVTFVKFLEGKGWRVGKTLANDRDVIEPEYGLVTYAAFNTKSPARLAADLVQHPATDLVMYPDGGGIAVLKRRESDRNGKTAAIERATIRRVGSGPLGSAGDRYIYERPKDGDPLDLHAIIEKMYQSRDRADDSLPEPALFAATVNHTYPDPLRRIWFAFNGVVKNPADVLVSLKEEYHHSSSFFEFFIDRASTHGSLGRASSQTFVLTTRCPLPPTAPQDQLADLLGLDGVKKSPASQPAKE
ncbi:MAG: hypothetical protein PHU85_07610 [Phycisphaerae bacterium]|nr:hypothetical protein [Phycisphaerae bacterium]